MTHEREPNIVTSSLSGIVTEHGITVRVNIIRLENELGWSLEVETSMEHQRSGTTCLRPTLPMPLSVRPSMKKSCTLSSIRPSSSPSAVKQRRRQPFAVRSLLAYPNVTFVQ